ncbi:MAG TPA: cytochrome c-type biogenesis protein CcmH, partial [Sphingopyxis sp.]|nr:cytochrome c-type biogenesis protein CcmH [Sphingopyxis sp.]
MFWLAAFFLALPLSAAAQDRLPPAPYAYEQLRDPAKEAQAKALMEELRCLVCQGQSIADSDAPLAGDMRHEVRSKIAAGESPEAIKT